MDNYEIFTKFKPQKCQYILVRKIFICKTQLLGPIWNDSDNVYHTAVYFRLFQVYKDDKKIITKSKSSH